MYGNLEYIKIDIQNNNIGIFKLLNVLKRYWIVFKLVKKFRPNLLLGSEFSLPLIGKILRIPSILFSEDDSKVIPKLVKITYPFVDAILSPNNCSAGKWEKKKIEYSGYHELSYLHPNNFQPKEDVSPFSETKPYFLLRFSKLSAHHDNYIKGINNEIAQKLLELLKPHGRIYITSERELEPQFEKYRINIDPHKMHHILYYTDLFIGDSQSMAMEAAVLGIPGIRFNDFVGKISVLNELENKYKLSIGIKSSEPDKLFNKVKELLSEKNIKQKWQARKEKLLKNKINVADFLVWFIENYPVSAKIMKQTPDYQYKFK
ncbi:MAG: DUF354 domain-containing protein [Bacteroidia bacterium]|nr:DUF354 domain-containing protein [Bacteroidia bacterium]